MFSWLWANPTLRLFRLHPTVNACTQDSSRIFIITAAAEKGDLAAFQSLCGRTLTPTQAVKYVLRPLVTALACMHAKRLVHRDIKPENMLLAADSTVQLCDFDLSIDAGMDSPTSRVCSSDHHRVAYR